MNCKISSLYICVRDMQRAIEFYEQLFDMPVTEKDDVYSVFEVGSFRFGLFAYEKKGEPHEFGSNCLPSISFDCLETKTGSFVDPILYRLRISRHRFMNSMQALRKYA